MTDLRTRSWTKDKTMRAVYILVMLIGVAAILVDHLSSPSSGRAVSPEDFVGACAPCGAPCPSKK
jgi:hypothetical protein